MRLRCLEIHEMTIDDNTERMKDLSDWSVEEKSGVI